MGIVSDLARFYDSESKKYYDSRKKYRRDKDLFLKLIKDYLDFNEQRKIKILEFGCGGGRFTLDVLSSLGDVKVEYVGVDISQKLLDLAKKDYPKGKFICEDITNFICDVKQEEFDIILGIASFQHIFGHKNRSFLMRNFYRALKYDGILILQNWSFSDWFIKKHYRVVFRSLWSSFKSFFRKEWNDLYIPWINKNKLFFRYYHIFTLRELTTLVKGSGFLIDTLNFVTRDGDFTKSWRKAKNSLLIVRKTLKVKSEEGRVKSETLRQAQCDNEKGKLKKVLKNLTGEVFGL